MSEELDVLTFVCHELEQAKISYMLTGSLASNFYTVPRMTRDIDIVIEMEELDIQNFYLIFQKDFYLDKDAIHEAILRQQMFNIIHNHSIIKVDFIIRKDALYRKEEFSRRHQIQLGDKKIWVVSPEDLVISKLFWARDSLSPLQLGDIKNLLLSVKNLDKTYIDKWVERLNLNSIYQRVKNNG